MATKAEEHRAADPPIRVPAEHPTAAEKRKEREEEEEEKEKEDEDEGDDEEEEKKVEIGSKRRRRCQLALDKESNGSFSFDTRCAVPIETTPKFGSFNYSALAADLAELGEEEKSGDAAAAAAAAAEQEKSGTQREVGGSGENKGGV